MAAAAAARAIAGGIYYLSGVLVKAETKEVAKKLIAKGFRTATDGIKNSGLKVQTVTNSNFVTYVTRALKKAMEQSQKIRQGPKLDSKTGRPVANNKLGSSGQSAIGRKLGSRRMANFGKVRGGKGRAESMAKAKPTTTGGSKPLTTSKPDPVLKPAPVKANPKPGLSAGSTSRTVVRIRPKPASSSGSKIVSAGPTIAGLIAAGAIGKVAYEAYIEEKKPDASQIKAANKKIAETKDQPAKEGSLVGTAGTKGKMQEARRQAAIALRVRVKVKAAALKEKIAAKAREAEIKKREAAELDAAKADAKRKNTPSRKKIINREVEFALAGGGAGLIKIREDADKKALTEVLNKKIKSRKSTAAKEKARAIDGEYKSLASAKKAGSLYYMHKGKGLRAAITAEETESASKRIRGEAMKKIREGK